MEQQKGYVDKASRALTQSANTAIDLHNTVGIMDLGWEKTYALDDWNQLNMLSMLFFLVTIPRQWNQLRSKPRTT